MELLSTASPPYVELYRFMNTPDPLACIGLRIYRRKKPHRRVHSYLSYTHFQMIANPPDEEAKKWVGEWQHRTPVGK